MCLCFLVCRTRRQARACLRARGMCPLLLSNIIEQSTVLSKCAKMFRLNVETTNLFHHSRQKHIIKGKPVYKGGERPKTKQITPPSVTGALIVLLQWHYISLLHCSSCERKSNQWIEITDALTRWKSSWLKRSAYYYMTLLYRSWWVTRLNYFSHC